MKYFITGGAGFIGSNFVNFIFQSNSNVDKVTVFDKFTYASNVKNLQMYSSNSNLHIINGDILDAELIRNSMRGHDIVIHFAAESHVDRSIYGAELFIKTNVLGTLNVLEAAHNNDIKTVIHVSTDEVYGSISEGSATENFPLRPNSPYAASKASSDLIARSFNKTYDMDIRVTRCCNNYGKYQYPEKVIPVIIKSILSNNKIPIYGDGSNIREWIHVNDHCAAILKVIENGSAGEVYNIGSGQYFTNLELAENICDAMGASTDLLMSVTDRLGHDFRYSIDSEKIHRIGFEKSIAWDFGITDTISWYTTNPNYWLP
jgi:dTDP-glucose 4,6-dehydratase